MEQTEVKKSSPKTIALWCVVIYLAIGVIFAVGFLNNEYKTFQCPGSDGTTATVYNSMMGASAPYSNCHRMMFSSGTIPNTITSVFLWLPLMIGYGMHNNYMFQY
jgi:hypothetical protein